ncbi:MAG: anhydro-N-acetylmuramic acid kinase [Crocinitomicaceae bacterium]|nr:anhydro-N-acetylmuramic acid kinase [Crocinitomicaceae bacterium]
MVKSYKIIGLMSGTSMDGVDIAYTSFSQSEDKTWTHSVLATKTYPYTDNYIKALRDSVKFTAEQINMFDKHLGKYFGHMIEQFVDDFNLDKNEVDAIASHGHTIFHQPQNGFTLQIGCGSTIASITGLKVINDFRTKDVIQGGQGAPLAPIGDTLLFSNKANSFLNIGGFANLCINTHPVVAFDIGPGNLPLNEYCQEHFNTPYDENGQFARSGSLNERMFDILNDIEYYAQPYPKSIGTEWLKDNFSSLISSYGNESPRNVLHTMTRHIAYQIGRALNENTAKSVLITGGGAKNDFLIELIKEEFTGEVIIPNEQLIDYKEAIIFGLLGALYLAGEPNTISTVTGAKRAVRGGVLHTP